MDFGEALHRLKSGCEVTRAGWNGKGMWLALQRPDKRSKMSLPYIYLNTPSKDPAVMHDRVPWLASQTDLLSNDWIQL